MNISYLTNGAPHYSWYKSYVENAINLLVLHQVEISSSGSQGGFLSIFEPRKSAPPRMLYLINCGKLPIEKREQCLYSSLEKATRLNEKMLLGHKTSRESANKALGEYAGSIYVEPTKKIFSFSGLASEFDEFLDVTASCIDSHLNPRKNYPEYNSLEHLAELYDERKTLITASPEQHAVMYTVFTSMLQREIEIRDNK